MVLSEMPHITVWRVPIACWLSKATDAHSECVILIAFPQKQFLCESASMLRHTYIASLVAFSRIVFGYVTFIKLFEY
jgi:hypothetical protein